VNASSIVLSDASWIFATHGNQLFGATPSVQGLLNLTIIYGAVTSEDVERVSSLHLTMIQIGNVTLPPSDFWTLCTSRLCRTGSENCFKTESFEIKSLLVTVESPGNYSIRAFKGSLSGFLVTEAADPLYAVDSHVTFFYMLVSVGFLCRPVLHHNRMPAQPHHSPTQMVILRLMSSSGHNSWL
jgi:hypothetical protein